MVYLLKEFTNSVERALKNPTIELRETQALVNPNAVRPISRTFMELAAKGAPSKSPVAVMKRVRIPLKIDI